MMSASASFNDAIEMLADRAIVIALLQVRGDGGNERVSGLTIAGECLLLLRLLLLRGVIRGGGQPSTPKPFAEKRRGLR
jgi:hypothetical protein